MRKLIKKTVGSYKFGFQFWFQRVHKRVGITNQCTDGKYIPFFDFIDNPVTPLERVERALQHTADEWGLSTIWILESTPHQSYRAFCLDKVEFKENLAILAETEFVDDNYLRSFARYKRSVLRVISKKERGDHDRIVSELNHITMLRPKSYDHANFFFHLYGIGNYIKQPIHIIRSRYESFR